MPTPREEEARLRDRWAKLDAMAGRARKPERITALRMEQVEIVSTLRVVGHQRDVAEGRARKCPTCRAVLNRRVTLREQGHVEGCTWVTSIEETVAQAPPLTEAQKTKIRALLGPARPPWTLPPPD